MLEWQDMLDNKVKWGFGEERGLLDDMARKEV